MYNLEYSNSGVKSSLILWYNRLLDKTYEELSELDVTRMTRQGILVDIATKRAVELFSFQPYKGEILDGSLIEVLTTIDIQHFSSDIKNQLREMLEFISTDYENFEWLDENSKINYHKNIKLMLNKIG